MPDKMMVDFWGLWVLVLGGFFSFCVCMLGGFFLIISAKVPSVAISSGWE